MSDESSVCTPLRLTGIDGIQHLPSFRPAERRLAGSVHYRWLKDQAEPAEFAALKQASLDVQSVEAHDDVLGTIRVRVTEFQIHFYADRDWFEGTVYLEGTKPVDVPS